MKPGKDGHPLRVEHLGAWTGQILDVVAAADGDETSVLDGKRLGRRQALVDRVDATVDERKVRLPPIVLCRAPCLGLGQSRAADPASHQCAETEEFLSSDPSGFGHIKPPQALRPRN